MTKVEKREHLAVVEPAYDTETEGRQVAGCLILSSRDSAFEISWNPFRPGKSEDFQRISAVFEDIDKKTTDWAFGKFFLVNCQDLLQLSLKEDGDRVFLSFRRRDTATERVLSVNKSDFLSAVSLIEQLLLNGIAVPTQTDTDPYALEFYKKCSRNVFVNIPPYIQLDVAEFTTLADVWTALDQCMEQIVKHLDESQSFPIDPQFPLAAAARSAYFHLAAKIDEFASTLPKYEPLTKAEFDAMFDASGRMTNSEEFFARCFAAGAEPAAMGGVLPFMFGVFEPNTTKAEREKQLEEVAREFEVLTEQASTVKKHQLDCHKKMSSSFRVIVHDVNRTDRSHIAFKEDDGPGLQMLSALLRAYCLYNPTIGYLQGMNDLYVPIILTYFPNWDENGNPVDENGNVISDYMKSLPLMFACFKHMLRRTNHLTLLSSVTEQCQERSRVIQRLLGKACPLVAIWMRRNNLQDLLWLYSDFVLLFKRTFEKIWPIWFQFNCSPDPGNWVTYFVAGLLLKTFPEMTRIGEGKPLTITAVMDAFPKMLPNVSPDDVGKVALWLSKNCPLPDVEQKPQEEVPDDFVFFEKPDWTKV